MTTCNGSELRRRTPLRPRARTGPARVAGPLAAFMAVQGAAGTVALLLGLPTSAVVALALAIALVAAVLSRRTLGSLLAGAGIRVARPYEPGEQIRVFVPSLDAVEDAEIVRVGPANTTLLTARGIVIVPNLHMLRDSARTP